MSSNKKTLSVVVPVFNEEAGLISFNDGLIETLDKLPALNYEVIYVDDGSSDDSFTIIQKLSEKFRNVKFIKFSRNFGKEAATTAGINNASGDACILIDGDGQHPAEIIPQFIDKWNSGGEVVIGVRLGNKDEGFVKRYGSKAFYKILNSLSGEHTTPGSTDFRLIDRKVVEEFNTLTERNRITRGLVDWLGFKRDYVYFTAHARRHGKASYGFSKLLKLAVHAFVSQSTKPLKFTGVLGFIVTLVSGILALFVFIEGFILSDPLNLNFTGTGLLGIFVSFLVGVVLVCQGLLALYIESIYTETQNRPLYIVSKQSKK